MTVNHPTCLAASTLAALARRPGARLLAISLLGCIPLACQAEQSSPPPRLPEAELQKLAAIAPQLPPLSPASREALEKDATWRQSLQHHDLLPSATAEQLESHSLAEEPSSVQPEDVMPKPAPMPGDPGRPHPSTGSSPPAPGSEDTPRRSPPSAGSAPTRAPPVETSGSSPPTFGLLARVAVDGAQVFFRGEATQVRPGEFLTAGHCLYFPDPDGDGDTRDACWASDVWIWPLAIPAAAPAGEPSGYAPATSIAVHKQWIADHSANHDVGIVFAPP